LFITHRLDEVMECADNITILRDGELVRTMARTDTTVVEMAELMVGRRVEKVVQRRTEVKELEPLISLRNFSVAMPGEMVHGIDLDIHRGEIFGIGGLSGQGKLGIANGIMGLHRASGEV